MKHRDNAAPTRADTLLQEAAGHFQNGNLATAEALVRRLLAVNPDHPDGNHLLGLIAMQHHAYEPAAQFIERAIKGSPHQVRYFGSLALALYRCGRSEEALIACDQAVKLKPRLAETHSNRAMLLRELGRLNEALDAINRALKLAPQLFSAHYNRAQILQQMGRHQEALEVCDRLTRMNPGSAEAHNLRGMVLKELNKPQDALAAYQQATRLNPNYAEAHNNRGVILLNSGQLDDARDAFSEALRHSPSHAAALYNLGLVLIKLGQYEEAVTATQHAIQANPKCVEAHHNLGLALSNLGRMDEAYAACSRAVQLAPGCAEAQINLGMVLFNLGRKTDALAVYDHAIELKPDHAVAHDCRGSVLIELGQLDAARTALRTALELDPHMVNPKYLLASLGDTATPTQSPKDYVIGLFDSYANRFDQHLVDVLGYSAPMQLYEAVSSLLGNQETTKKLNILDLGCGTGLCGAAFSGLAKTLVGVDLAPQMIAQARRRNLYTELIQGEICESLERDSRSYHLMISADVFIYIGDLERVFELASQRLTTHGLLAFSIELHEGSEDYVLRPTGRYAQSIGYIKRLAHDNMFEILSDTQVTLRFQEDQPIIGRIIVLRRTCDHLDNADLSQKLEDVAPLPR